MFVGLILPPVAVHLMVAEIGGDRELEHESDAGRLVAVSLPVFIVTALCPVLPEEHVSFALIVSTTSGFDATVIPGLIVWLPVMVQRTVPHALNVGGATADAGPAGATTTSAGTTSSAATVSVSHRRSMCGGP